MFTGLVAGIGRITDTQAFNDAGAAGLRLYVAAPDGFLADVQIGDSIAVNGACLTVAEWAEPQLSFIADVSAETLACTTGLNAPGAVNLEKALAAGDRLGGHMVSGHVDGVGSVVTFEPAGESWHLAVLAPQALARYFAYKGSVTVNGVSLTVNRVTDEEGGCRFDINLIPHTVAHTTLGELQPGDHVNLEVDLIARYVERMLADVAPGPAGTQNHPPRG